MNSKMLQRSFLIVPILALSLAACGGSGGGDDGGVTMPDTPPDRPQTPPTTPVPLPPPGGVEVLNQFGFAAIACDHDDPFDAEVKTDYSDEVAGFTNTNQVCLTGDQQTDTTRLADAASQYAVVLSVEPAFFDFTNGQARIQPDRDTIWSYYRTLIDNSGVDPSRITFYMVDEPSLRGLSISQVNEAAQLVKADYPDSMTMVVEAFSDSSDPVVPSAINVWGFNSYAIRDPGADPAYVDYLDKAAAQLTNEQSLVIVGDGIHTPVHTARGLSEADMAEVANNYLQLVQNRPEVSMLIVYSWAGGIDGPEEKGVRNLPAAVQDQWRAVGQAITGN